jgi:hypothetical protein
VKYNRRVADCGAVPLILFSRRFGGCTYRRRSSRKHSHATATCWLRRTMEKPIVSQPIGWMERPYFSR